MHRTTTSLRPPFGLLLAALTLLLAGCGNSAPDVIFRGGPVLTVNTEDAVAQALAMRDGVITAVGTEAEVMATKTASTQVIDLQGKTLMPGFVGAHEHPTLTAVFNGAINLSGFSTRPMPKSGPPCARGWLGCPRASGSMPGARTQSTRPT